MLRQYRWRLRRTIGSRRDLESTGSGGSRSAGDNGVENSVVEDLGSLRDTKEKGEGQILLVGP